MRSELALHIDRINKMDEKVNESHKNIETTCLRMDDLKIKTNKQLAKVIDMNERS